MSSDPYPSRVGNPLSVEEDDIWHDSQLSETLHQGRAFPKGKQAGNIGEFQRKSSRRLRYRFKVRE